MTPRNTHRARKRTQINVPLYPFDQFQGWKGNLSFLLLYNSLNLGIKIPFLKFLHITLLHFHVNIATSAKTEPVSSYICFGSCDGKLVEPLVVVYRAFAVLAGDQLRAKHPPGQIQMHHTLHCRGPVVQRQQT